MLVTNFSEAIRSTLGADVDNEEAQQKLFNQFDTDGDQGLSTDEVEAILVDR